MLKVSQLNKYYGKNHVIKDVSFNLAKSSIIGLIGINGAGKTTIMKQIVGLLKPDSGEILFNNININKQVNINISYIPDKPVFFEELTVNENLKFYAKIWDIDFDKINQLSKLFSLEEYLSYFPTQLSKGNQQKIMIIFSLLSGFDLLVADEPFTGLDPEQVLELKQLLLSLKKDGKTILISTHQLDLAETICDSFIFINKGTVIFTGTVNDIQTMNNTQSPISIENFFISLLQQGRENDNSLA